MSNLQFEVQYYDDDHKSKLEELAIRDELQSAVAHGMSIPEQEVLVYTVFREQKQGVAGWETFDELKSRLPNRLPVFYEYFDLSDSRIRSQFPRSSGTDNTQTESAGVGSALAVVSKLIGLTEADWERIPVMRQKALDFEICASEFGFIEVEAKGAVTDSEGRSDLSNMKLHIERKKAIQRRQSDRPAIRIGVITSFRNQLQRPPLVRLLDPPAEPPTMDPGRFKLLARLNFYRRELNVISQAHFLSALATRISSLSMVKDFQALDEMPLLDGRGEPLRRPQLTSRSTVEHEYAFGEVVFIAELGLLFYGMRYEVVDLVLAQSHRAITDYQNPDLRVFRTITGRVLETELEGAGIDPGGYPRIPGTNRRRIQLTGHLYETTSGRVFGWVKERWSRS